MTREERIALHKKQERMQIGTGVPRVSELTEGVPVIRATSNGLEQYIRHNNQLYKMAYTLVTT
tara:strand:+ start:3183 stop:3371 length:189 start_codon:yes stop_codon:yes gene_type:complete